VSAANLQSLSVIIDSPILEVFDFVGNPDRLPEWVPFYSAIRPSFGGVARVGDEFAATISLIPPLRLPALGAMKMLSIDVDVTVDDVVQGRRITYRSVSAGWSTTCDLRPSGGQTVLTVTHSLWSGPGLWMTYWMGPLQIVITDALRQIMDGLKRRLEGRGIKPQPRIFFSYRRDRSRYVGGRIYDALVSEFGPGTVFRDTESLLAGNQWQADIDDALRKCSVIVAHIGEEWETDLLARARSESEHGADPDGLRLELEKGLESENVRFIPVLTAINDTQATYQRLISIEEAIARLSVPAPRLQARMTRKLEAQRLRADPDFARDIERLMRSVWNALRSPKEPLQEAEEVAEPGNAPADSELEHVEH
jgi:hypothetical protein